MEQAFRYNSPHFKKVKNSYQLPLVPEPPKKTLLDTPIFQAYTVPLEIRK
jgi:hypothetical protein